MSYDTDYAVAKALGWEVVPANKAHSGTFEVGKTYLFQGGKRNGLYRKARHDFDGLFLDAPWSPSTSADDAIAALEAAGSDWLVSRVGSEYYCDCGKTTKHGQTMARVICAAIIAASEPQS